MTALEDEGLASSHDHRRQSLSSSRKRVISSSPIASKTIESSSSSPPPLPLTLPLPPTCVTLMTLVKDERYHMILSEMTLDVLQSHLPRRNNTSSQQEQQQQQRYRFQAEAQLLASLFHMYYAIQPSFFLQKRNNHNMISEPPPPMQTMAMKFMDLIFVVGETMTDQEKKQPSKHHVWKERRTIQQFLFVQIVWRYIILKMKEIDTSSESTTENENNSSVTAVTLHILERIFCKKSSDKQDCHDYDDKDQRMVKCGHPAKEDNEQPLHNTIIAPVCTNNEHLSGLERRQVFEEQRRRLMERAAATSKPKKEKKGTTADNCSYSITVKTPLLPSTKSSNKSFKCSTNKRVFLWLYKMLYPVERLTISILKQVASNYSTGSSFLDSFACGSHLTGTLNREDESGENNNADATNNNATSSSSLSSHYVTRHLFKIIQRLHLALFFVEGKYPTILHRLFRIQYRHRSNSQQQQIVTPHYASYNLVSLLIFLQCLSDFGQLTGSTTLVMWRSLLTRMKKWKYNITSTTAIINTSNKSVDALVVGGDGVPSKEKSFLEQLEELVPSMASVVNPNEAIYGGGGYDQSSLRGNNNNINQTNPHDAAALPVVVTATTRTSDATSPIIICAVCRQSRRCPSGVSPLCGHVFCWECILSWTSTHKPECPFCRTPCPPQTVLALFNY